MISTNLRILMAKKHFNIQMLSDRTGLSRTTISNLYNGNSKGISFRTIAMLCSDLDCNPSDLFERG